MNQQVYISFTRSEWAKLRANTPMTLSEADLQELRGVNERISLKEVVDIYLPLARLLNLYISATQTLYQVTDTFLGNPAAKVPYLIGIAGSVAVGKSTTARILQTLLTRCFDNPKVDLVTTDGFLYPNQTLQERGIMKRKGFPESYDLRRLVRFVADIKSGHAPVQAPIYSHLSYDIIPHEHQCVDHPDILIIEGLNILQGYQTKTGEKSQVFVSDFLDFTLYVDAQEYHLQQWYIERFLCLCETVFQDEMSYFCHYAKLPIDEAIQIARQIWTDINGLNLRENILPTRERANLILEKGHHHSIQRVKLRKL